MGITMIDFTSEIIKYDQHYCVVYGCDFDSLYELQQLTLGQMQNHKLEFISKSLFDKMGMKEERFETIFMNPFCSCQNNCYIEKNIDKIVKQNLKMSDSIVILFPMSQKSQVYKMLQTLDIHCFGLEYIHSEDNQLEYQILIIGKLAHIPTYSKLDFIYEYLLDDGINVSFYDKMCLREVLAKLEPKISVQNILRILQKQDQSIRTIYNQHIGIKHQKKKLVLFLQYILKKNLVTEELKQRMIEQGLLEN